jgi:kumamolisin
MEQRARPRFRLLRGRGYEGSTTGYPSGNPWLVSAGGTSVERNSANGAFYAEYCWSGAGGGTSTYETWTNTWNGGGNIGPWANFQYPIFGETARATPDQSSNADPASGVYVYSGYNGGWFVVGGTSVASPSLPSIVNRAGNRLGSYQLNAITGNNAYFTTGENNLLYAELSTIDDYKTNFYDVKVGSNGSAAVKGWDYCTGVGSPRGLIAK